MNHPSTASHERYAGSAAVLDRDSRLRFLVIEDSPSDSELVRALLAREFPQGVVDVASRLEVAVALLQDTEYDVVLADLGLPDAQGDAVVRAVHDVRPETALLVLTGRADESLALLALAEGAQDYLVKGMHDGRHFREALLHGMQRNRAEQEAKAHLAAALELERRAVERLRDLNAAKDDFVRTASHELRTPLASIVAYAELLQEEGGLTESQQADLAAITRNAARLTALADDLMMLATADVRRGQREPREVDLREVVHAASDVVGALALAKDVTVRYELPEHPVLVSGEGRLLQRVLLNLLNNAVKFSEQGGAITCTLSASSRVAVLTVSDNGIGIPASEHGSLFDRFFRGAAAHSRAIQGTGLGLHIADSIVGDHGGDISVESVVGRGSTFTVRLPALAASRGDVTNRAL